MHQGPAFLSIEVVDCGARGVERPVKVNLHHRVEILVAHLVEIAVAQDSRIVHHRVDAAELLHGGLDHGTGVVRLGYATTIGDGVTAGGLDFVHDRLSGGDSLADTLQ